VNFFASETQNLDYFLWNKLAAGTRQRDPFCCSPAWQLAFHDAFSPNLPLLIKQSNDSMISFSEKARPSGDICLMPVEHSWCFGSNVMGPDGIRLLGDALIDFERHYAPYFPKIMVSAISRRGALYQALRNEFSERFDFRLHRPEIQCAASLSGGFDGFLSRRSANSRRNMKKQTTKALAEGITFERHCPASDAEAGAIYGRMIAIEHSSWKGINRCGMAEKGSKTFYAAMLKRLSASGDARIIIAKHEDEDIGFIFGGMAGKIYRGQQFSFDHKWAHASVGNVMQAEQIKWLCEEVATRYDMGPLLGRGMEYKKHWTERRLHIETWVLTKRARPR
jgi:hypothetical protein